MKKYRLGYTQGTYDMFHIGHLNLLRQAKTYCDILIVGINSDYLVQQYKSKIPIVGECERMEIVQELRCVDKVIKCDTLKKKDIWSQIHFDAIFIGSDWIGNDRWRQTEIDLAEVGVDVVYLKHTDGISSSLLREKING